MKTDICIVGGGIMGLATAYNLAKATDYDILLLDRYGITNDYAASNDVNRVFRYSYGNDKFYTDIKNCQDDIRNSKLRKQYSTLTAAFSLPLKPSEHSTPLHDHEG